MKQQDAAAPLAAADYAALGHLHRAQAVRGWESKMFYSGSPLRMSFDETDDAKTVNVVTFGAAGAPPEVRRLEVPVAVPLVNVAGSPEQVRARLGELVADAGTRRYVRILLDGFEGEARRHWEEFRQLAAGSKTLVLDELDLRPAASATSGLNAFAGRGLRKVSARDLAELKLETSDRHFDEAEVAAYLALFDEAASAVDGGVA